VKYLPLIWAGLWRKRLRTIFTLLSIVVAFLLFGILQGVDASMSHLLEEMRLDRLYTMGRFTNVLPIADLDQIERVPGVRLVAPQAYLGGYYQDPKVPLAIGGIAMIDERIFDAFPEFEFITKQQRAELFRTRTGLIISKKLAERFGWHAGDKVPLHLQYATSSTVVPYTVWTFDVVAVTDDVDFHPNGFAIGNYAYLDEARPAADKGAVGMLVVRIDDPDHAGKVARTIDNLFANSASATRTISERTSAQSDLSSSFNVTFFTKTVVGAAFFTLLFLTGNTMMQSVRERNSEFAVLKTLGFSDSGVLAIVFAESLALCAVGAALGLTLAGLLMPLARKTIGIATLPPAVLVEGALAALLVALLSGLLPGLRARRLSIVDALAGR
jgi:putative ABC transport system permease protein